MPWIFLETCLERKKKKKIEEREGQEEQQEGKNKTLKPEFFCWKIQEEVSNDRQTKDKLMQGYTTCKNIHSKISQMTIQIRYYSD